MALAGLIGLVCFIAGLVHSLIGRPPNGRLLLKLYLVAALCALIVVLSPLIVQLLNLP
jgi:hypothetical protein